MQLSPTQEHILAIAFPGAGVTVKSLMRDLSVDYGQVELALRGLRSGKMLITNGKRRGGCSILFLSEAGRQKVIEANAIVR